MAKRLCFQEIQDRNWKNSISNFYSVWQGGNPIDILTTLFRLSFANCSICTFVLFAVCESFSFFQKKNYCFDFLYRSGMFSRVFYIRNVSRQHSAGKPFPISDCQSDFYVLPPAMPFLVYLCDYNHLAEKTVYFFLHPHLCPDHYFHWKHDQHMHLLRCPNRRTSLQRIYNDHPAFRFRTFSSSLEPAFKEVFYSIGRSLRSERKRSSGSIIPFVVCRTCQLAFFFPLWQSISWADAIFPICCITYLCLCYLSSVF